jgi:hypothetical protein
MNEPPQEPEQWAYTWLSEVAYREPAAASREPVQAHTEEEHRSAADKMEADSLPDRTDAAS